MGNQASAGNLQQTARPGWFPKTLMPGELRLNTGDFMLRILGAKCDASDADRRPGWMITRAKQTSGSRKDDLLTTVLRRRSFRKPNGLT